MSKNKALIKVLVDHSGSMSSCLEDAQGGYDTFIKDRQTQRGLVQYVSLTEFDNVIGLVFDFTDVQDVPEYTIHPSGSTSLNDAMAQVIEEIDAREEANDSTIEKIVVVITDGYENSSRRYPGVGNSLLKEMVEARQEAGWVFLFLGANQDAVLTATKSYGISRDTSLTYDTCYSGVATASASNTITRGLSTGTYAFTPSERTASSGGSGNTLTWMTANSN